MSWVWPNRYVFNATCMNIDDLKGVTMQVFIMQLIGAILTLVSTSMICIVYWGPFCKCKKINRISPEDFGEALAEYIQIQRTAQVV